MSWKHVYVVKRFTRSFASVRSCKFISHKNRYSIFDKKHSTIIKFNIPKEDFSRQYHVIRDYNFDYFRTNVSYNSTVVKLNNNVDQSLNESLGSLLIFNGTDQKPETLFSHLSERENVMRLSASQIKNVMCSLANSSFVVQEYPTMLKWLDEKCSISVNKWPLDLTLYVFDAWLIIIGQQVFANNFFSAATRLWTRKIQQCTKNNIIQILYYIGLQKKAHCTFLIESLMKKMEEIVSEVSDLEWAIACVSCFKMSAKLNSELLLSKTAVVAEGLIDQNERFHLISTLKCLRQARHYDEKLSHLLCQYIKKNMDTFNFVECTNFLAALSSQSVYDSNIFKLLEDRCVQKLSEEKTFIKKHTSMHDHPSLQSRVKDVARFLWSLVSVGHILEGTTIDTILEFLYLRLSRSDFQKQPHVLVDSLHSLVLADIYSYDLLQEVLKSGFLERIWSLQRDKPRYQLYFLLKSIQIEHANWIKHYVVDKRFLHLLMPIPKNLLNHIQGRDGFQEAVSLFKKYFGSEDVQCCYVVPHIVIASILITRPDTWKTATVKAAPNKHRKPASQSQSHTNDTTQAAAENMFQHDLAKEICIEILDPTVCCRDKVQPSGLLKTKIRQLKKLSYEVKVVSPDEITCLTNLSAQEQQFKVFALLGL